MSQTVIVPVADGTEEIEAVTIVDTLRRAGLDVTVAAVGDQLEVVCSRGVKLVADALLDGLNGRVYDAVVLPGGGPGAENLSRSDTLRARLDAQLAAGRLVGAICAAPAVVLARHDLIGERHVTGHPSTFGDLPAATRSEDRVVVDGNLVTSRGPGTALEFALQLVEILCGQDRRREVADPMLVPRSARA